MKAMNRRQFLQATTALTLTTTMPGRAAEAGRIRVGLLGASHSHALEKFRILRDAADYELLGICEPSGSVREPFRKLGATFLERDDLLERATVVVVESAVRDHARDAMAALHAGRHVHLEKPPAVTLRECQELVRLATEQRRLLQVGYMWRYHPGINRLLEAVQKGWLGEVFLVRGQINTHLAAARRPEWAEFKGGAMFELGCHMIEAVMRILGQPTRVTPHLQRRGGDDLADNCTAILEFAKAQAIVSSAVLQPNAFAHRFLEVLGTNGTARIQPLEPPVLTMELARAAGPYPSGSHSVELPVYRRYVDEFAELSRALRAGRPLSHAPEAELLVHETLLRACKMQ